MSWLSLFRLISWPYLRKHVLRTLLTTAGIILGVAVFVAMRTANQSVLDAFSQTVDRIAGKTELQITLGDSGFNEEVLEKVQSASTVRVAVPVIEALVDAPGAGQSSLLVIGVDMTGDRSLRDYDLESDDTVIDDPLVFLAQPDSLMVSREFAARNHIASGARLALATANGERTFTVRGIMKSSGLASAFGGSVAVMDIYAAQRMFGRGRTFDRIDLAVQPGVTLDECARELHTLLGPQFEIQPPAGRGQQFESLIAGYSVMVSLSSAFALFIGMFIIYNAFAIAVVQRRSEIGVLRALGATRAQVRGLFLGESAVLGLLGSGLGIGAGLALARAMASFISQLIADVYGVAQRADEITAEPSSLLLAGVLGIVTSLVAALLPAHAAARIDAVHALQKGRFQQLSSRENRLRVALAAVAAALALVSLAFRSMPALFYAGYALALVSALLLIPLLSLGVARALRPVFRRLRPVEGTLAADSLIQAPRRVAASVAAVMLSLALVIGFSGMARASVRSIVDWMQTSLTPDLVVLPSQRLDLQTTRFPAAMESELASIPGVERVQAERDVRVSIRQSRAMVIAMDLASLAETDPRPVIDGSPDMYRRAAAGEGVIVAANLAEREGLNVGDLLEIPAPQGMARLPVVGVVVDYSDQNGAVLVDRRVFVNYWNDDSANAFRVFATAGQATAVRQRIIERYSGVRRVFVLTNGELRSYIMNVVNQWFGLTSLQIAVAVVIAILGIVNSLTVSIIDRRRELGVLRAVGALNSQVRGTIWLEAIGIATIGLVLGVALGALNLYYVLQVARHISGMHLEYGYPVSTAIALVPLMIGAGLVAALWPAESAVRGSLVEALEYE